jgi:hypothetical protein
MPSTVAGAVPLPTSGVVLEYKYNPPEQLQPRSGNGLAVLLHPWAKLGGNLNDP